MAKVRKNFRIKYFTAVCVTTTILYLFFRSFQFMSFLISTGQRLTSNTADINSLICKTETNLSSGKPPLISNASIESVVKANPLGGNLVENPKINIGTDEDGIPLGYSHSIDADYANYSYDYDRTTDSNFLGVKANKTTKGSTPAWLINPVHIAKGTYSYGLRYKSDVPVSLSLEATLTSGKVEYKGFSSAAPSENWKLIDTHINNSGEIQSVRIILSPIEPGHVQTKEYDIHQIDDAKLKQGIVTLTFDDGWKNIYTNAIPVLNKNNMFASIFVITNTISKDGNRLNEDDLRDLQKKGYEIGSHSLSHCNQSTLSRSKLDYEAIHSKKVLEDLGVGPINVFSYPLGSYNDQSQDVYTKYFKYIRTSDDGYNDKYYDKANIKSMSVTSSTSESDLKQWLKVAKDQREWLVINYHEIGAAGEYNLSTDEFEKQIELISKSGLKIMTLSKAGDYITSSKGDAQK